MANSTANPQAPQEEGSNSEDKIRDLESQYNLPAVQGRDQARDLQQHFNAPSENIYDSGGTDPSSLKKSAGDKDEEKSTPGREDLARDESTGAGGGSSTGSHGGNGQVEEHENQLGSGFKSGPVRASAPLAARLLKNKKVLGGAGGGIFAGLIIAFFIFFLPALKLESYLATINQRVFAFASDAVQKRTEALFERYMVSRVLTIQRCGNKVTAGCRADYSKAGIASDLYNSWQDARIENKLFEQYGIEVQSYKNATTGEQRFKLIDKAGRIGNPGDELTIKDGKLSLGKFEGGPRVFGGEWSKYIQEQTKYLQVMQRRSVRKFLVRKHGTKFWCFFACEGKDSIDNAKLSAKTKLKYKLIERTVYPFSTKYGIIMQCLSSGREDCWEKAKNTALDRGTITEDEVKELDAVRDGTAQKFSQVIIERMLVRMGMDPVAAHSAVGTIPVIGQLYLAFSLIDMFDGMINSIQDGSLSKIAANITSAQYIEYYTNMREAGDEVKAGKTSLADTGALMDQFNGAEQSKVYQAENNANDAASSSSFASIFSQTAYAATIQSTDGYTCSNGKPIPAGQLVCSEKTLDKRSFKIEDVLDSNTGKVVVDLLDSYSHCFGKKVAGLCVGIPLGLEPKTVIHPILQGVNFIVDNTVGSIVGGLFSAAKLIPGVGDLISTAEQEVGKLTNAIFTEVFPLPVQPDSPGREKYDGLEAGGELTASEFGQGGYTDSGQPYGLGGKVLTPKQQTAILQDYQQQQNYDYQKSSLLAKVTNLDYSHSIGNQFIAAMPTSFSQFGSMLTAAIMHPFSGIHFGKAAFAYNVTNIDPFGIPKNGYPVNDPAFNIDPALLTDDYCNKAQAAWEASKTVDPVTGADNYSTTNACLLEKTVVEDASSAFTQNDSLDNGSSQTTSQITTSTAAASIDMTHIEDDSSSVACAPNTKNLGVEDGWYGGKTVSIRICAIPNIPSTSEESNGGYGITGANGSVVVNSRVSGSVYAMAEAAKKDGINLTANSGFRTMAHQQALWSQNPDPNRVAVPGTSNHQMGLAIDFGGALPSTPGPVAGNAFWNWLSANAATYGYKNYPAEAWHWSVTGN